LTFEFVSDFARLQRLMRSICGQGFRYSSFIQYDRK